MPNSRPTVSAILTSFNGVPFLERALASVRAQTYAPAEIIVVDDGSTDGTPEMVVERFPEVTLLTQENSGLSVALNRGAAAASGDLLAFLDHDDAWLPTKLERQVQVLTERPETDLVLCLGPRLPEGLPAPPLPPDPGGVRELIFRDLFIWLGLEMTASSWLVRRRVFAPPFVGFDPRLSSMNDHDALLRLCALGYHVDILREHLFLYYVRPNSLSRSRDCQLELLEFRPQVLRGYDPEKGEFRGLLTPLEYRTGLQRELKRSARMALDWGNTDRAKAFFREAASCPGRDRWLNLEMRLAARLPWPYLAVRRLLRRVVGHH